MFCKLFLSKYICATGMLNNFFRKGKIGLKKFLYEKSDIAVNTLPYNQKVLQIISHWKKEHPEEKVFLISATHYLAIEDIAKHLGCFDGWYGTKNENLKSHMKLNRIKDLAKTEDFSYIGDSFADLVIWKNAKNASLLILIEA